MKAKPSTLPREALLVSGLVLMTAAALFEWMVVLPEHPGSALLRVVGAAVAAFVVMLPFRRT